MFNKKLVRRIEELENQVEQLQCFKKEHDLKELKQKITIKEEELSKKYNLNIVIRVHYDSFSFYTDPRYNHYLLINSKIIFQSSCFSSEILAYKGINYDELEDKIKIFIHDNVCTKKESKKGKK